MAKNLVRALDGGTGTRALVKNGGTAKSSGDIIVIGETHALLLKDAGANEEGVPAVIGAYECRYAKLTTDDVTPGAVLYFDATNNRLTLVATGNKKVGLGWETTVSSQANCLFHIGEIR